MIKKTERIIGDTTPDTDMICPDMPPRHIVIRDTHIIAYQERITKRITVDPYSHRLIHKYVSPYHYITINNYYFFYTKILV